jgi:hypothetical protein
MTVQTEIPPNASDVEKGLRIMLADDFIEAMKKKKRKLKLCDKCDTLLSPYITWNEITEKWVVWCQFCNRATSSRWLWAAIRAWNKWSKKGTVWEKKK